MNIDTRRSLIRTLCELWLRPYENIFGPGSSDASLPNTKRRYLWIARLLKDHDDKYAAIFPDFWLIQYHFVVAFCTSTAKHLKTEVGSIVSFCFHTITNPPQLGKIDPPESVDVGELMRALRATLDFEQELTERYQPLLDNAIEANVEAEGQATESSLDAIKARHERRRSSAEQSRGRKRSSIDVSGEAPLDPNDEEIEAVKLAALKDAKELERIASSISSVFEPYLVSYVKRESEGIQEQLAKVLKEERVDKNGALPVLSSALNLFLTIKSSIARCIKFTTGQAFYDLHREFKTCLQKYSSDLNSKLPKGVLPGGPTQPTTRLTGIAASSAQPAFDVEAATTACFVLNSAEYCAETVSQLEEMIQGRIDEAYAGAINLEEEQDLFYTNVSNAVQVLVEGIKGELLPELQKMQAIDWGSFDQVGDQSAYLTSIVAVINAFFPTIRDLLSDIYFRTFCDKFVFAFLPLYVGTVYAGERIGEFGAQQLLLDTRALKTALLQIVKSGDEDQLPVDTYNKFVTSELERCEVMLKLVSMSKGTESSLLLENFQILWKDG